MWIMGAAALAMGVLLFVISYLLRERKHLTGVFGLAGASALALGLVIFVVGGLESHGKSSDRAQARKVLREQRFVVLSIDSYGTSAKVRGSGGCAARVTIEMVRGRDTWLVMQGDRIVTPETVAC